MQPNRLQRKSRRRIGLATRLTKLATFVERLESRAMLTVFDITGTGTAYAQRVETDGVGNVYVTGSLTGTVDFDPSAGVTELTSAGNVDAFLAKYSSAGALQWARRLGGVGFDQANCLAIDSNGNAFIGGRFEQTASVGPKILFSAGGPDGFIASFDPQGTLRWADSYGGGQYDEVNGIGIRPDGTVVAAGSFEGVVDFNAGPGTATLTANYPTDVFILNVGASGQFGWVRQFTGVGYQYPRALAVGGDGSVAIVGSFYGTVDFDPGPGTRLLTATSGLTSAFVAKLDASGNLAWAGNLIGTMQFGESVAIDGTGSVYVSGTCLGTTDFDFSTGTATKNAFRN